MDRGAWQATVHGVAVRHYLAAKQQTTRCFNVEDPGSIPGLGRSPGEGNGNPFQYSCLENPMDRGEPGGLQSMRSQTPRHNLVTKQQLLFI